MAAAAAEWSDLFVQRRLDAGDLARYVAEGYLNVGRLLTDEGLERLRRETMAAWDAEKRAFAPERSWLQNSLLVDIHHRSPTARRYYFWGPLVDIAQQLIGPNIKGATSQLTFKLRGNTMPFGWHQDNGYGHLDPYNTITTLTALDDTDEGNGCLWVIPGSHRQGQIEVTLTPEQKAAGKEIVVPADDSLAIPRPMKAGEALVFTCWTLHKSDGNHSTTRDRRILFLRYADADAVEVYNDRRPRLGRLVRGNSRFPEVTAFEADLA